MLRRLALLDGLSQLAFWAWMSVFVLYAVTSGPLGLSEVGYGTLLTGTAVGSFTGSLTAGRLAQRIGQRGVMTAAISDWAVFLAAPLVSTTPWVMGALLALGATAGTMFSILSLSLRQLHAAGHILGRGNAAHRTLAWSALPLGALLSSPIASSFGLELLFVITAVGTLTLSEWSWTALTPAALDMGRSGDVADATMRSTSLEAATHNHCDNRCGVQRTA